MSRFCNFKSHTWIFLQGNSGLLGKILHGGVNRGATKMSQVWWSTACLYGLMNMNWPINQPLTGVVGGTCKFNSIEMSQKFNTIS